MTAVRATSTTMLSTMAIVTSNDSSDGNLSPPSSILKLSSSSNKDCTGKGDSDWHGRQYAMTTLVTKTGAGVNVNSNLIEVSIYF